ncbi:thiazole biosynthesis adenylyltransferase ThiF [Halobacillus litoralis]|uniref:thiazole biosynthesis adenylyltransferase ThiF n=1 Tax=Halobacillus litoralis TaxID=45668 RepID=UPI001CD5F2C1|nr:thiazole biosynthesis adenylyltransferase ThiF [Halobacillus litoralis]MCA0972535.1 thiazole biosynthesis adenylyltransferase ThiF [Halobacillus litoralis]
MSTERYSRQRLFSPIGDEGQQKMSGKHVLIVGVGALGTSCAEQLVRAGVGHLTLIDRDYVEWSNLQRQQLFSESDADSRLPKVVAAKSRLEQLNHEVHITGLIQDAGREELEALLGDVDVMIDATDNFETRLLMNDLSQMYRVPWIYGACVSSHGMSYTIIPGENACLRCLMDTIPMGGATCDTVGVISPAVQMVTAHQVTETLKLLVEDHEALTERFITFDLWKHRYSSISVDKIKKEDCPSCGTNPTYPALSIENQTKSAVLCGRNTVQIRPAQTGERDFEELKDRLPEGTIKENPFLLSYDQGDFRFVFFRDGRVLIHGTKDITEAKTMYQRIAGG